MAIEIRATSDSKAARKDLEQLSTAVESVGKNVNKFSSKDLKSLDTSVQSINNSVRESTNLMQGYAKSIVVTAASAGALASMTRMQDTLANMGTRINIVTESQEAFSQALKDTKQIALETRQNLGAVANLYAKVANASGDLGVTQKQVAKFTSAVSKSLALSGSTASESAAAILQLGQALGSGRFQGDELRSITENAQYFAKVIADYMNTTISGLRTMGAEGKLLPQHIMEAILANIDKIDAAYKKVNVTFGMAFTKLGTAATLFFDKFSKVTGFNKLAEIIDGWADSLGKVAMRLDKIVIDMRYEFFMFFYDVEQGFKRLKNPLGITFESFGASLKDSLDGVKEKLKSFFNFSGSTTLQTIKAKVDVNKIDIGKFIPNLEPMKNLVWEWAESVERAFFWVYDEVIGHSWIPDLVEGVIEWMEKLTGKPLTSTREFVKKVNNLFENMYRSIVNSPFVKKISDIFDKLSDRIVRSSFVQKLSKQLDDLKDKVNSSKFGQNLRQAFGMKAMPGTYEDPMSPTGRYLYDTTTPVGRGPYRSSENRPFLHDITNSFAGPNQIAFISTFYKAAMSGILTAVTSRSVLRGIAAAFATAGALGLASVYDNIIPTVAMVVGTITTAFASNPVVKAIAGVMTTAYGLSVAQNVQDTYIDATVNRIIELFRKGVNLIVEGIFGSGLFGDKGFGGTLSLIAKLSLLFASGRQFFGRLAVGAMAAPANFANTMGDQASRFAIGKELDKATKKVRSFDEALKKSIEQSKTVIKDNRRELSRQLGKSWVQQYDVARRSQDPTRLIQMMSKLSGAQADLVLGLERARLALEDQIRRRKSGDPVRDRYERRRSRLSEEFDRLDSSLKENVRAFRAGIVNTGGGIGGIFGALGGFNFGAQIVEQMKVSDGWQAMGIQLASAFVGQMLGALGGQMITRLATGMFTVFGLKIAAVGAIIAGIAYVAYKALTDWDGLTQFVSNTAAMLEREGNELWAKGKKWFEDRLPELKKVFEDSFEQMKSLGSIWAEDIYTKISNALKDSWIGKIPGNVSAAMRPSDPSMQDGQNGYIRNLLWLGKALPLNTPVGFASRLIEPVNPNAQNGFYGKAREEGDMFNWGPKLLKKVFDFIVSDANASEAIPQDKLITLQYPDLERLSSEALRSMGIGGEGADIAKMIIQSSREHGLGVPEATRLLAIAIRESGLNPNAKNPKSSASGVFQIMPNTAKGLGMDWEKRFDPKTNIDAGVRLFKDHLAMFNDLDLATDAHHAGATEVRKAGANTDVFDGDIGTRDWRRDVQKIESRINGLNLPIGAIDLKGPAETTNQLFTKASDVVQSGIAGITDLFKELEAAYEEGGVKQVFNSILDKMKAIGETAMANLGFGGGTKDDAGPSLTKKLEQLTDEKAILDEINRTLVSLNFSPLAQLPDLANQEFRDMIDSLEKSQELIDKLAKNEGKSYFTAPLQKLLKDLREQIKTTLEGFKPEVIGKAASGPSQAGKEAGRIVADNFKKELTSGFSAYLKGEMSGKELGTMLLDKLTSDIVDTFSTTFIDTLFNGSGLQTLITDGVAGVFDFGITAAGGNPFDRDSKQSIFSLAVDKFSMAVDRMLGIPIAGSKPASEFGEMARNYDPFNFGVDTATESLPMGKIMEDSKAFFKPESRPSFEKTSVLSGGVTKVGTSLGSDLFSMELLPDVEKASQEMSSTLVSSLQNVGGEGESIFSSLGDTLGGIFKNISGMFSGGGGGLFSSLFSFLFFSNGGSVTGPGTGTSDSIPAMLSHGEFVVKAKQANKFRPLLQAINNDSLPKFAEGGSVGSTLSAINEVQQSVQSTKGMNNSQVININITGDISRQTKKEIYAMLPEIAHGVNSYNREVGYRG